MAQPFSITIDDKALTVEPGQTILEVCDKYGIHIPVMCRFKGLENVGACRMCLVELEGSPKLFPACTTPVAPTMKVRTTSEKLKKYRRMTVELMFAERNHICAVCVANNNCDLQKLGYEVGMEHVRFPYLYPKCNLDASHPKYVIDQNRCILCARCVRVCSEVESAHNWDIMGRGHNARIIADFNQPWGESATCTSCGKCIQVCPTGTLWEKNSMIGRCEKSPATISELVEKRKMGV